MDEDEGEELVHEHERNGAEEGREGGGDGGTTKGWRRRGG